MGDEDDNKDIFQVSDFIWPHNYFTLPILLVMVFLKLIKGSV